MQLQFVLSTTTNNFDVLNITPTMLLIEHDILSGFIIKILCFLVFFTMASASPSNKYKNLEDESPLETAFTVKNVNPEDFELLPSLGNGHIATTPYSDFLFMSGLYSGSKGNSHRAKIPNPHVFRLEFPAKLQPALEEHLMSLNAATAVWSETWIFGDICTVQQRVFAHRHFPKLMVTQIEVTTLKSEPEELTLNLVSSQNNSNKWSDLKPPHIHGKFPDTPGSSFFCAQILEKESHLYSHHIIPEVWSVYYDVPNNLTFTGNQTYTFISGFGASLSEIRADWQAAAKLISEGRHDLILDLHVSAWQAFSGFTYTSGPIEVIDNLSLAKVINAAFYYILSSLPSQYSLSPAGLPYGAYEMDYQGHVFWDTETWLLPPLLYFYPGIVKDLLNYRVSRHQPAKDRSNETGYEGARYPWESAATGLEVSPENFFGGAISQVHISSDISFAIRQYTAMTRDLEWLTENNVCDVVRDIAQFWSSRVTYDEVQGYHLINNVMSPDEDHDNVDNNPFTNIGAAYSIFFAKYLQCLCGAKQDIPEEWEDAARSLKLLYDKDKDYHPEYEGYQWGTPIKQADVVLMGYPLQYPMSLETRKNDLRAYENATRENGPAMTWSMHAIANFEVGWDFEAESMFNRSYQWYTEGPWRIWREWIPERVGPMAFRPASNFLTGMGGFLQGIMAGYGGIRVEMESMRIGRVKPLPGSKGMRFRGLVYLGNKLDVEVGEGGKLKLAMESNNSEFPLEVRDSAGRVQEFVEGALEWEHADKEGFWVKIRTTKETGCELPYDRIGELSRKKMRSSTESPKTAEKENEGYGEKGCSVPKAPQIMP